MPGGRDTDRNETKTDETQKPETDFEAHRGGGHRVTNLNVEAKDEDSGDTDFEAHRGGGHRVTNRNDEAKDEDSGDDFEAHRRSHV